MERPRRRPEPAAIDITWVSCRGVRSSLPFHTPCLYASIFVAASAPAKKAQAHRRPHRVKTPTDRAGGENPEWDAPLRLYLPDAATPSPQAGAELVVAAGKNSKDNRSGAEDASGGGDDGGVLLVRFEIKAEVAVLGDVLAASAAVPVPDLVADGRTRRVSYQLWGPDGRQPNGVICFSYAFHARSDGDGDLVATPPACATPTASTIPIAADQAHPPPTAAAPRLYPVIEWPLTEQIPVYPPATAEAAAAVLDSPPLYYPPPPPPPEHVPVYPPLFPEASPPCSVYPRPMACQPASALYPTVDLAAAVSCYPPAPPPPPYGLGYGFAAPPEWDGRCLYG